MHTGTDVSMRVCRAEGYAVVKHGARPLDPEKEYLVTISNPAGWHDSGTVKSNYKGNYYAVHSMYSYKELYEHCLKNPGVNKFCGTDVCPFASPEDDPCYHEMAHLAQTLHNYCGLP